MSVEPDLSASGTTAATGTTSLDTLVLRHLRWGWCALGAYLALGIVLEALHGFKIEWYLSVANETRRLLWRLAHTHGTLLGLVHLAFAFTLRQQALSKRFDAAPGRGPRLASAALCGATLLLPGGFLLGGIWIHAGDPGRAIVLVPVGAALLLATVVWMAARVLAAR